MNIFRLITDSTDQKFVNYHRNLALEIQILKLKKIPIYKQFNI